MRSDGQTVEGLFRLIDDGLTKPQETSVLASYDARRGYPTRIYVGPPIGQIVFDGDVSYTIELIESPAEPLTAPTRSSPAAMERTGTRSTGSRKKAWWAASSAR
jgi:hypothetical protein